MANEFPKMSLKQATPLQSSFTPFQFTPKPLDTTSLERSLDKIEAREKEAITTKSKIDASLGEIQSKLNNKELKWFTNYKDNIKKQIQEQIDAGNYSTAILTGTQLAGNIMNDAKIIGREQANANYQKKLEEIQNDKSLSSLTRERWAAQNPYKYNDVYDDSGNVIGGSEWKPAWTPVNEQKIAQLQALAAQLTAARGNSSQTSQGGASLLDKYGNDTTNLTNAIGMKTSWSKGSSTSIESKTYKRLKETFNNLMNDPEVISGLNQQFDSFLWAMNDRQVKAKDMSFSKEQRDAYQAEANMYKQRLTDENGYTYNEADIKKWINDKVVPGLESLSYTRVSTGSSNSYSYDPNFLQGNRIRLTNADNANDSTPTEILGVQGAIINGHFEADPDQNNSAASSKNWLTLGHSINFDSSQTNYNNKINP